MRDDAFQVLDWLSVNTRSGGEMCSHFKPMVWELEMERAKVRRLCRLLHRKGMAEFHKALCDDEGRFKGSGYCISKAGIEFVEDQDKRQIGEEESDSKN